MSIRINYHFYEELLEGVFIFRLLEPESVKVEPQRSTVGVVVPSETKILSSVKPVKNKLFSRWQCH